MTGTGNVLSFPNARGRETPVLPSQDLEHMLETRHIGVRGHLEAARQSQLAKELYPAAELSSSLLSRALKLLRESGDRVETALLSLEQQDFIGADDATNHLRPLLDELFCCRSVSSGLAMISNALFFAVVNRRGQPLEVGQLRVFKSSLRQLEREPMLSEDKALNILEALEDAGLVVSPNSLEHLADSDESLC